MRNEITDDKELYKKFLDGDTKAFEKLIYKYKNNLTYFIYRYVKDLDIAEDIFQEVALYVFAKKNIYNFEYSFKSYLFTIAKTRALNYVRDVEIRNKCTDKMIEDLDADRLLEDIIIARDINREIKNVIGLLNPDYQTVIYLGLIEELSYSEIAELMGKTVSQVKNLLHKARVKLRKLLIKRKVVEIQNNKLVRVISILIVLSILITGIGYAAYTFVSKKEIKPSFKTIGILFSENFENYKEQYDEIVEEKEEEVKPFDKTEVKLISSMCGEGFVVLEFEVDLTEEDRKYLRLDESVMTEKDWENYGNMTVGITEEEAQEQINEAKEKMAGLFNSVTVIPNAQKFKKSDGTESYDMLTTGKVIVNDEVVAYKGIQSSTNKINDYKYQVFLMYFLTDEQVENQTEFTMTLKNIVLKNGLDVSKVEVGKEGIITTGAENFKILEVDEEFEIKLSKEKVLADSKIIEDQHPTTTYKKMTKTVDKVTVSPVQTIIKIDTEITDVSLQSLSTYRNENHIGIVAFQVYDQNGNEIKCFQKETKRIITYNDGTVEEWVPGDIGTYKTFYGATMNLEEFLVIETDEEITKLTIKPYAAKHSSWDEDRTYLDEMVINLK